MVAYRWSSARLNDGRTPATVAGQEERIGDGGVCWRRRMDLGVWFRREAIALQVLCEQQATAGRLAAPLAKRLTQLEIERRGINHDCSDPGLGKVVGTLPAPRLPIGAQLRSRRALFARQRGIMSRS